jgi:hypothetical protein
MSTYDWMIIVAGTIAGLLVLISLFLPFHQDPLKKRPDSLEDGYKDMIENVLTPKKDD